MNFELYASKLENFLKEEFTKKTPLLVLKDNSILYKRFKIKKNDKNKWQLNFVHGDAIDSFMLKASATIAAQSYDSGNFDKFNEIKILDSQYWQNAMDAYIFRHKMKTVKDLDKLDIFVARWEIASTREAMYKSKITSMFRSTFDK